MKKPADLDQPSIPIHLGIIVDGNRRWATEQGLKTIQGHKKGVENIQVIAKHAWERGIKYLSLYVFSTENWNRSQQEVSYLMDLFLDLANQKLEELIKEGVQVRFLGSRDRLEQKVLDAMDALEERTKTNSNGVVALCLNYGGQKEIADAATAVVQSGKTEITEQDIADHLYQPDIPPLDLVIRTSGEQRLSNFMLWRAAYAELYFAKVHWPGFTPSDLDEALADYASRHRRFGS
jgi:undecaprenyl diphosphate synthase